MIIPAPAGFLEIRLERPATSTDVCAVLCHPHPLYGGSLHDAVLDCMAGPLLAAGTTCLRFNFRGVGSSSGSFDNGAGEIEDLLTAIDWLQTQEHPSELWLGGYSFGAWVVWQSLAAGTTPDRLLLVAPPVGRLPFDSRQPGCPTDIFAGTEDAFIDQDALAAWAGVNVHALAGADHFFVGCHDDLRRRIELVIA
jgi:alpha/beta superfamily hydrolase